MPIDSENVGVAFAAVCAAGASTAIGASVVFFPKLVKLASRRVLAASLGFSAGVMIYVSFVEIFQKSLEAFKAHAIEGGYDDDKADSRSYIFGTLSFFAGVVVMIGLNFLVDKLSNGSHHGHAHPDTNIDGGDQPSKERDYTESSMPHCIGCVDDPVAEVDAWQTNADKEIEAEKTRVENQTAIASGNSTLRGKQGEKKDSSSDIESFADDGKEPEHIVKVVLDIGEKAKLKNMGLQTAIAIAIHNFPEGLATFVAVLSEPKVGVVLAIAIGIHNVPEGLCVSLPVYYATGNRRGAFWWGALSGITEPIGAFFGWLIFAQTFSEVVYGLMFGIVAGMMVMISFRELLPTANRFDPKDCVVSYSAVVGMFVMALSLILANL